MSVSGVSLVVIQLEISSDSKPLTHLHYIAPKFAKAHTPASEYALKVVPTSDAAVHKKKRRGWREPTDITVETLTGDGSEEQSREYMDSTKAILQLFKENQTTQLAEEAERSEMVAILAIPAGMTTSDLLHFTDSACKDIEYMRIIRKANYMHYMALIKFTHQLAADEFFKNFNGVVFGPYSHICHLVYVAQFLTVEESQMSSLPLLGHTELPTCPVCLERMDESVEGILSSDLSQASSWNDSNCVICKLCQASEQDKKLRCFGCRAQESLWTCLVCGSVGCGRYIRGHAYEHFTDTLHTFALQLGNSRVWDYAGDNYVHRLLTHKPALKTSAAEEKMDALQLEYTYLLTSQLETQRRFFEDQLQRLEKEGRQHVEEVKEKARQSTELRKQLESQLEASTKEKQAQEARLTGLSACHQKLNTELRNEARRHAALRKSLAESQDRVRVGTKQVKDTKDSLGQELVELQQQLKDLKFFIEAQSKLQEMPQAKEGSVVVGPPPPAPTRHRHRPTR